MRSADIRRHQASQEAILASFRADENIGRRRRRRRPFRTVRPIYPAPLRSSLSLPFSLYIYLSISLSVCFLSLLCPSVGSRQLDPLCSRSGRAIFICSVSSVVFLRTLDLGQHAVMLCASCYYPLPFYLFPLFPNPIWSPQCNFPFFFFPSITSCLVASTDDVENSPYHQYSFSFFDSYCVSISVTICNPSSHCPPSFHFISCLVLSGPFRFDSFHFLTFLSFQFFLLNPLPVSFSPSFSFYLRRVRTNFNFNR